MKVVMVRVSGLEGDCHADTYMWGVHSLGPGLIVGQDEPAVTRGELDVTRGELRHATRAPCEINCSHAMVPPL